MLGQVVFNALHCPPRIVRQSCSWQGLQYIATVFTFDLPAVTCIRKVEFLCKYICVEAEKPSITIGRKRVLWIRRPNFGYSGTWPGQLVSPFNIRGFVDVGGLTFWRFTGNFISMNLGGVSCNPGVAFLSDSLPTK